MARQLTFDLALRPAFDRDDFLVAPSNQQAVALVDQWPRWTAPVALIVGPPGSGKTHLAHVWQRRTGAIILPMSELTVDCLAQQFLNNALVLEDAAPGQVPEKALFHAFNVARQNSKEILITSAVRADLWNVRLPDLTSRLKTLTIAEIQPPDDALLRGVLVKNFMDRQLSVDEGVIAFMLSRMSRSLAEARSLIARIDAEALEQGAEVTRSFVSRVMRGATTGEEE